MKLSQIPRFARTAAFVLAAVAACTTSGGDDSAPDTEECKDACAEIAAASCGDVGSECVDRCVHQPSTPGSLECAAQSDAYVACFWRATAYTCDEQQRTVPEGCDDELAAAETCANGPDAGGAGGAAGEAAGGAAGGAAFGTAGVGGA